ncbi:AI-2E family transporter [Oceanibium sediminis]|uniref:AI-2E family transporter n=1 Tax=Oceanibium sediminis TaxID=2026339 RepID=UPI000DD3380D|nr:AI-2E family transporter [Oceanibium sediminis]
MTDERISPADAGAIRRLLTAILILMIFVLAYFAKAVVLPLVLGSLLALTLSPVVRGAERMGIPSAVTAGTFIFGMAAAVGLLVFMMGDTISGWLDRLPAFGDMVRERLSSLLSSVEAVKDASDEVEKIANGEGNAVQRVAVERPPLLASAVSNLASFVTSLVVGMILAFFILSSGNMFYVKLVQAFPRMRDKKRALTIVYDIERRISHYLLAITVINAALGICIGVAMWAVGMPYAYLWGLLAFALNYLPFIGSIVGAGMAAGVAIVTFDSLAYASLVPLAYLVLTSLEAQFVTPMVLGRRLQLNTVSVFLTVIFWGWLWGIPGALMAVPALVVLKVVSDNVDALETLSRFLSGRDDPRIRAAQTDLT